MHQEGSETGNNRLVKLGLHVPKNRIAVIALIVAVFAVIVAIIGIVLEVHHTDQLQAIEAKLARPTFEGGMEYTWVPGAIHIGHTGARIKDLRVDIAPFFVLRHGGKRIEIPVYGLYRHGRNCSDYRLEPRPGASRLLRLIRTAVPGCKSQWHTYARLTYTDLLDNKSTPTVYRIEENTMTLASGDPGRRFDEGLASGLFLSTSMSQAKVADKIRQVFAKN